MIQGTVPHAHIIFPGLFSKFTNYFPCSNTLPREIWRASFLDREVIGSRTNWIGCQHLGLTEGRLIFKGTGEGLDVLAAYQQRLHGHLHEYFVSNFVAVSC